MAEILIPDIKFIDIKERETLAREQLRIDINKLEARKHKNGGLSAIDAIELHRLKGLRGAKRDAI